VFQGAKLTPNDLITLLNGIYPLPIYRGHGSLVFNKKLSKFQVFSKKKYFIAFHFQSSFYCKIFQLVFKSSKLFLLKFFSHFTS